MSTTAIQATALVTGSFLSGKQQNPPTGGSHELINAKGVMTSLSLIAIPVFLDSITQAPQLFYAWERMYHYGHQALPTMSVGALGLWAYAAAKRRGAKEPWRLCALAGATTVLMVPFTWFFMVPTNNELFRLAAAGSDLGGVTIEDARALVVSWGWMHLTRAAFPLAGAIFGAIATFKP
ncbi:MAG: hypothetical protein OHK93_004519 [Ramalina farinacea]|uniref:Anthrone oxygenase n=1 Tax=Ramalina farinacea TaxID=258253 RepID=A0AA43U1Q2_9LECA|nr:hypothetical protein [Ramalina farinacea]